MSQKSKYQVFLVGFMGVGKTTVGRLLSRQCQLPLLDLDAEIERIAGYSIRQIFERESEAVFRDKETEALVQLEQEAPCVVSTGGGIIGRPENWEVMQRLGRVVYLHAEWETLAERLKGSTERPLADDGLSQLHALWIKRLPLYRQADVVIETDGLSPQQVVDAVIDALSWGRD
jgi:shikimate kinase